MKRWMTHHRRRSSRSWSRLLARGLPVVATLAWWNLAFAAGGKTEHKLVNVADTRAMSAGFAKWTADIYNANLWLYAGVVVLIMAGLGIVLGLGMDKLISGLGINLGKLDHHHE